jgi:hypothetical protein
MEGLAIVGEIVKFQVEEAAMAIQNKILDQKKKPYIFGALLNMMSLNAEKVCMVSDWRADDSLIECDADLDEPVAIGSDSY